MPEYRIYRTIRLVTTTLIDAETPKAALEEANKDEVQFKDFDEKKLVTRVVCPLTRRDLLIEHHDG